jgi:hypothetical protein
MKAEKKEGRKGRREGGRKEGSNFDILYLFLFHISYFQCT